MTASDEVRCLYLPLTEDGVLLPVANVAEVVALAPAAPLEGAPGWITGEVAWRGRTVALCTWEPLIGERFEPPGRRGRIVVLHGLSDAGQLPFLALVVQAVPSVVLASAETVHWIAPKGSPPADGAGEGYVAGWVDVDGREAWIPNLDVVEAAVVSELGAR